MEQTSEERREVAERLRKAHGIMKFVEAHRQRVLRVPRAALPFDGMGTWHAVLLAVRA